MKKYDVVALGELLIDFTMNGMSEQGNYLFEVNPGGAPCNVLSMLQRLGKKTAFIGKVGEDFFGKILQNAVKEQSIDISNLVTDKEIPTTLAFVHTASDGDRSFSFYRNPGADMMLQKEDFDISILKNTHIFHFGTLSMTDTKIENVTKMSLGIAKEYDALISFDPNFRPLLWKNLDVAREKIAYGMSQCHILKYLTMKLNFLQAYQILIKELKKFKNNSIYHLFVQQWERWEVMLIIMAKK